MGLKTATIHYFLWAGKCSGWFSNLSWFDQSQLDSLCRTGEWLEADQSWWPRAVFHPPGGNLGLFSCPWQGSKKTEACSLLNWHNNVAAIFYWPKQVTRQRDSKCGEIDPTLNRRHHRTAWQKVCYEKNNWGSFCRKATFLVFQYCEVSGNIKL